MKALLGKWFGRQGILRSSIRYKIIAMFLCCFIISLSVLSAIAYALISGATLRDSLSTNATLLSHVADNVNSLLQSAHSVTMSILTNADMRWMLKKNPADAEENLRTRDQAHQALINLTIHETSIASAEVIGADGDYLSVSRYYSSESFRFDPSRADINDLFTGRLWRHDGRLGYYLGEHNRIVLVRTIRDADNLQNELGIVAVHMQASVLSEIYTDRAFSENTETYIVDEGGMILSSSKTEDIGRNYGEDAMERLRGKSGGYYFVLPRHNQDIYCFYQKLNSADWYVVAEVPAADLTSDNKRSLMIGATLVICAAGSLLAVTVYLKRILSPLAEISRLMKEIEKENYAIGIRLESNDEIGSLAKSFNRMALRLNELVRLVYSFEIRQRDAQIALLRSQINPHFLYNVMDIIYWRSRLENAVDTAAIVQDFSQYLRKSITDISTYHSVEEELEHLRAYVNIQKRRFDGRIEFVFDVDERLMGMKTIPFVLQPLVENAIYHGVQENGGVGTIGVTVRSGGPVLYMEVRDDGPGADIDEISRLMVQPEAGNRGFAVHNINDRVRLLNGEGYGLSYMRSDDETVAAVTQRLESMSAAGEGSGLV